MTNLEITLISIIWASYGAFAAFQTAKPEPYPGDVQDDSILYATYIILAPIVLVVKMLYGAFKKYE